jgi:hypothetical protein
VGPADAVNASDARAVTEDDGDGEGDADSVRDARVVLLARADADALTDVLSDADIESERHPVAESVALPVPLFDCVVVDDSEGEGVASVDAELDTDAASMEKDATVELVGPPRDGVA